ncbi:MAG: hypothetical protein IKH62_02925, partial [Methanobrevibacter sp.]|nr:hypothetical protein [Methanobrevibacter sp.]
IVIPNIKFSENELELIKYCLKKLSNSNAHSITKYATRDPPIIIAGLGDEIDFRYVFSRDSEYSILKNIYFIKR